MAKITIFEEQSIPFVYSEVYNAWVSGGAFETVPLAIGETYTIRWNGEEYTRTAFDAGSFTTGAVALGNGTFIGGEPDPDGLTFLMGYSPMDNGMIFLSAVEVTSVTVSVTMEIEGEEVLPITKLSDFAQDGGTEYISTCEATTELVAGETYIVMWDGIPMEYMTLDIEGIMVGLGNENCDPFAISFYPSGISGLATDMFMVATVSDSESHTVGIYKVGGSVAEEVIIYSVTSTSLKAIADAIRKRGGTTTDLTFPDGMVKAIGNITSAGTGGSSDDVRYVTFKNGNDTIFIKPVAVGDDCVDVHAKGMIETPTKASSAQYDYTYSGWCLTDGASANSDALKGVTEDRTVYAAYSTTTRSYTVTFYDSDGVTILNTETVKYGSKPSYAPTKDDYIFAGWEPTLTAVTGDTSYTAIWDEGLDFTTLSWTEIDSALKEGKAHYFKLGARKSFNIKLANGQSRTVFTEIVGINHDDLADGSGKAGLTMRIWYDDGSGIWHGTGTTERLSTVWFNSAAYLDNYVKVWYDEGRFPTDLSSMLKTVTKKHYDHSAGKYAESDVVLFMPSISEFAGSTAPYSQEGTVYEYYADGFANKLGSNNGIWTRTKTGATSGYVYYAKNDGTYTTRGQGATTPTPVPNAMLYCCI